MNKIENALQSLTQWVKDQSLAGDMPARTGDAREDLCQLRQFVANQSQAAVQNLPDSTVALVDEALG